jgi:hypothetical protein
MQGTIAQIVALVAYGNAILQDAFLQSAEFQSSNTTFTFCESVQFVDAVPGLLTRKEKVYAADTHSWFQRLRNEGVYALRLGYGPSTGSSIADRMLVGFVGGGGKWLIEARGPKHADRSTPIIGSPAGKSGIAIEPIKGFGVLRTSALVAANLPRKMNPTTWRH